VGFVIRNLEPQKDRAVGGRHKGLHRVNRPVGFQIFFIPVTEFQRGLAGEPIAYLRTNPMQFVIDIGKTDRVAGGGATRGKRGRKRTAAETKAVVTMMGLSKGISQQQ